MLDHLRPPVTLLVSLAAHALVLLLVTETTGAGEEPERVVRDVWSGSTVEIEAVAVGEAPASPASDAIQPAPAPPPAPAAAPEPLPEPDPRAAPEPQPRAEAPDPQRSPAAAATAEDAPAAPVERSPSQASLPPAPTASAAPSSTPPVPSQRRQARAPSSGEGDDPGAQRSAPWLAHFERRADRSSPPSAGPFGADARAGVRDLAKAFTRAIPVATVADRAWASLPLGPAGSVRVAIDVDAEGQIGATVFSEGPQPPHLKRLVERTVLLIRAGRFSLSRAPGEAGSERLRIDVTISGAAGETEEDDFGLGFHAPSPGKPGKAYFKAWGRYVEARVTIE